jgi:hypothetical protein
LQGLGNNVLKDVKKAHENNSFAKWRDMLQSLTFIDRSVPPTPEQIAKYAPYTNLRHKTRVCGLGLNERARRRSKPPMS